MSTMTYTDTLHIMECGKCHVTFAMPQQMYKARLRDGNLFYCPNGHASVYRETENMRLKAQLDQALADARYQRGARDRARAESDHNAAVARGYKGALVKTKKRIGRGVCPCCNRHFADVERHMATKHPAYAEGPQ